MKKIAPANEAVVAGAGDDVNTAYISVSRIGSPSCQYTAPGFSRETKAAGSRRMPGLQKFRATLSPLRPGPAETRGSKAVRR